MSPEEAQVTSLNAMLDILYKPLSLREDTHEFHVTEDVLYNEESLDTPYDGADEEDEFQWFGDNTHD